MCISQLEVFSSDGNLIMQNMFFLTWVFFCFVLFCFLPQASKAGLRIYRPGLKMEEEESQGWFSWMWNWGGEADTQTKETKTGGRRHIIKNVIKKKANIRKKNLLCICFPGFDELLTSAEKSKLYTAIGYSETAVNPNLPKNVSIFPL